MQQCKVGWNILMVLCSPLLDPNKIKNHKEFQLEYPQPGQACLLQMLPDINHERD
jgi:hypothetical protein